MNITSIKTIDFANLRDPAISQMISKMEDQKPSNKRIFQQLPKHLRRRAMSYDIRKVPKSMQPAVKAQVDGALEAKMRNKPKGRDHMKYRPHGKQQAMHRNENFRWLETHLWHAKRFHMGELWGWKVPIEPTMKQNRSLIKMTNESCTIRDISYLMIVEIKGNGEAIKERLKTMVNLNLVNVDSWKLRTMSQMELYKINGYPLQTIGPVSLFWINKDMVWIIIHPLLKDDLLTELKDLDVTIIDGELNIFEVCGPLSTKVIRQSLQPSKENDEMLQKIIYGLPHPSAVLPGFSIAYLSSDPRTYPDHLDDKEGVQIDFNNIPEYISDSPLFNNRNFEFQSEDEFNQKRAKLLFPMAEGPSGSIPIILMQRYSTSKTGFGASWLVFAPFGCGSIVFKKFVKQGSRVFGLENSRKFDLEAGRFNFPYDRPDTNSGLQIITKEMVDLFTKNNSKPKGKQIELNFYQFPNQFCISFDSGENSYIRIGIKIAKRGTPSRFSTIYIPDSCDYQYVNQVSEIKGTRTPIGMVLNGNSSILSGEGQGIGLVQTDSFISILPQNEASNQFQYKQRPKGSFLALIKEQGSQFYHPAWIFPHSSNFYP